MFVSIWIILRSIIDVSVMIIYRVSLSLLVRKTSSMLCFLVGSSTYCCKHCSSANCRKEFAWTWFSCVPTSAVFICVNNCKVQVSYCTKLFLKYLWTKLFRKFLWDWEELYTEASLKTSSGNSKNYWFEICRCTFRISISVL